MVKSGKICRLDFCFVHTKKLIENEFSIHPTVNITRLR